MSEVIDLLAQLVSISSVNPMGRDLTGDDVLETRMGHFLEAWFQQEGIPCQRQTVEPGRDNIIAHLAGGSRTVLFEAHQDVVPVDNMTIDPWKPEIRDGRLWGRGSCDTKAGMAGMMTAMRRLKTAAPANMPSVTMLCVVDEEHQFRGISKAFEMGAGEMGIEADMAIVAEPTELEIVASHKGVVRWKIVTEGISVHSANRDDGVNAIVRMGQVIQALENFHQQVLRSRTDPALGNAALSIGCIRGGTSVNTVPNRCEIEIDRRLLPGEEPMECIAEVHAWLTEHAQLDFAPLFEDPWVISPPLQRTDDETVIRQLAQSCDRILGSHKISDVAYGTDAPVIAGAGIPVVVFGAGSVRQAHSKDEWVSIEQVEQATEVFYDFLVRVGKG